MLNPEIWKGCSKVIVIPQLHCLNIFHHSLKKWNVRMAVHSMMSLHSNRTFFEPQLTYMSQLNAEVIWEKHVNDFHSILTIAAQRVGEEHSSSHSRQGGIASSPKCHYINDLLSAKSLGGLNASRNYPTLSVAMTLSIYFCPRSTLIGLLNRPFRLWN